ncbi:uncharacterized protein LOC110111873 [Dendrobium catenatum]|uniref:uncharacterized protein LOC110111873 n=1 Tax=Dendrobium catenatum TaxID=906689 RepID=UPI0009F56FBE|nr:uncharacterized protein LOC110111873 [Dendrobium catenatum]
MRKVWPLKGAISLISLADGFFLIKFSSHEDYDAVWSGGPWFLLGKPFILQQWSPKFKPKRDENASIPIWIKIVDFPLALWTPTGISKIASYIGIHLTVDSLTAKRSCLTFARVCVLISKDSPLPDEISLDIDGEDLILKVLYDWKPTPCEGCRSLVHPFSICPRNPNPSPPVLLPPRPPGRSSSRPPRPNSRPNSKPPSQPALNVPLQPLTPLLNSSVIATPSGDAALLNQNGRIWIKWDPYFVSFSPTFLSSQLIHGVISMGTLPPFQISVIYATNNVDERASLWNKIRELIPSSPLPWLVMGDLNCYKFHNEKAGGNHVPTSKLQELNGTIFDCGLHDLASVGLFFTWHNQRADEPIHIKLDRVMVNSCFLDHFPLAHYKVASPNGSDHSPLITSIASNNQFLFKNYWTFMDGFWEDVFTVFFQPSNKGPICHLHHCLQNLKGALKKRVWDSSNHLSNQILELKNQQLICLEQIQLMPLDPSLNSSLKIINSNLTSLQASWASWVSQRAKANWLSQDVDDLGFLYAKIRARRNHNNLFEITDDQGIHATPQDIASAFIPHFKNLFNASKPINAENFSINPGICIPQNMMDPLITPFTYDEIKLVIFSGYDSSAPGPDGFTFAFFKRTWHISGPVICNAAMEFLNSGYLPRSVKATALALIPKGAHVSSISDFLPISLCNVLYKFMAKLAANRLKLFYLLSFMKAKWGLSKILDILKAFDTVSHDFLFQRLRQKGFPELFIKWVKGCISNVFFSICINEALNGFFGSSFGLRHGCPLSPLLFCIFMDGFSCTLENGNTQFIGPQMKNLSITHLLYADDVLVFGKASSFNAHTLAKAISIFSNASGLFINQAKSSIIFSKDAANTTAIWFLFHGKINDRKHHLISWSATAMPTRLGGIGIPSVDALIYANHCAFIWRFFTRENLAMAWFRNKYISPWKSLISTSSKFWRKVHETAFTIKGKFSFKPSRNCNLSMEWDHWCNDKALIDIMPSFKFEKHYVQCYTDLHGWILPPHIPTLVLTEIMDVHFSVQLIVSWNGSIKPTSQLFTTTILELLRRLFGTNLFGIRKNLYDFLLMPG